MLIPTAIKVIIKQNYLLGITFNNGVKKIFDVKPYINSELYGKLWDVDYFNRVKEKCYSVEWSNG